jgi:hypothetical protein
MTQPLHYTSKAIEALSSYPWAGMPIAAAGCGYLADKLRQAQVFVLSDHGELLDRSRPRPEVPGVVFRPPFDVVALEYTALACRREDPFYTATRSSRRIALAWDWRDDLPPPFPRLHLPPGVVIASVAYIDDAQLWMPMSGAVHLAYEDEWQPGAAFASPFRDAMIASGQYALNPEKERSYPATVIPLMLEVLMSATATLGSKAAVFDTVHADLADEVNAYSDLCYALACKNVSTREHRAPEALNRHRIKAGKLPLNGFHVLELSGGGALPGAGGGPDRSGPRSHLRRGHIRRLPGERVTWVNSTVVRGRGFVDKVYAA